MLQIERVEELRRIRRSGFELARKNRFTDEDRPVLRRRLGGMKSTAVMVSPELDIEFQELRDGANLVVSHRLPTEGVDFLVKEDTVFVNTSRIILPSCDILGGPCVSESRGIGQLHLGERRLVARAQREAEVLA